MSKNLYQNTILEDMKIVEYSTELTNLVKKGYVPCGNLASYAVPSKYAFSGWYQPMCLYNKYNKNQ